VHTSSAFAARSILEPLTNTAVVDKFRDLTADSVDRPRQDALIDVITHLEQQADLELMHHLLLPTVRSPFETTESPTGA
jgi:hypothetical protein